MYTIKNNQLKIILYHSSLLIFFFTLAYTSQAAAKNYVVNYNDVIDVSVYDHPEMTTTVRVDGQGIVVLPLLNQVTVKGMSISEASAHIATLLADGYIINPQVNLFIQNFREQKASILGQVVKPGVYDLTAATTLLELISHAGGLTSEAGNKATVQRDEEDNDVEVELNRLIDQGDLSLNIQILDGDKIFIEKAGIFYVTGEVKKPDSYTFQAKMTVIKAIAMAGGFTDTASANSVRIVRKENGKEKVLNSVSMDDHVKPEDVIVVPESFF